MNLSLKDQIAAAGLPEPVEEFRFHTVRRWRWDLCWPERMLALEIQGGVWSGGRHTRGKGYENDCEKLNEGILAGWRVLWIPTRWIANGLALALIERAMKGGSS